MFKVETIPPPDGENPHDQITKVGDLSLAVNEALIAAKLDVQIGKMPTRRLAKFDMPEDACPVVEPAPPIVDDLPIAPAGVPRSGLARTAIAFGSDLLLGAIVAAAIGALLAH